MKTSIFDHDGILKGQQVGEISELKQPGIVRDDWIAGNTIERRDIDRDLEKLRQRQYADQWTMFRF